MKPNLTRHTLKANFFESYSPPFWQDRNLNGGGVMIYIREDIPCKVLLKHNAPDNFEGIFLELIIRWV